MKQFNLNRVSGWKNINILIRKTEIRLKTILNKTSTNYLITHFIEKQWEKYKSFNL